jgi:hypothetical protein
MGDLGPFSKSIQRTGRGFVSMQFYFGKDTRKACQESSLSGTDIEETSGEVP